MKSKEYSPWYQHDPFKFEKDGYSFTIIADRYELYSGRRQYLILEDTVFNYRNADWLNKEEYFEE